MKGWLLLFAAVVVVVAIVQAATGHGPSASKPPSYPQHFASEDGSADVSVYSVAWEALINDCNGSPSQVANYVDNTAVLFAKQGQGESHLRVMTQIARSAEPIAPTDCDQIAAALLTIAGNS